MSTDSSKLKSPARLRTVVKSVAVVHWRDEAPCEHVPVGVRLSVESREPFVLHFGHDGWQEVTDLDSTPLATGLHATGLDLKRLGVRQSLEFTRRFLGPRSWEHHDWQVRVEATTPGHSKA
jgi:glucoamylase